MPEETDTAARLSLEPEIAQLRGLLRAIGSDDPATRETAEAEAVGVVRLVGALARCIALEQGLRDGADENGGALAAMLKRAMDAVNESP